jgi:undecaprenyl-diphosphatase
MSASLPRRIAKAVAGRGWFEARTLLLLLVIFVCLFVFASIADEVREGETQDFDHTVLNVLRTDGDVSTPRGPRWLLSVARDVSALGGVSALTLLTFLVLGFLALHRKWRLFAVLFAAVGGATVLNFAMKRLFDRERPEVIYHLVEASNASFPSGHSMLSATTYLTLGLMLAALTERFWTKVYFLAAAVLIVVLVGLSRIYLGVHFPTDVAAGWSVGAAWALGCALVARRYSRPVEPGGPLA